MGRPQPHSKALPARGRLAALLRERGAHAVAAVRALSIGAGAGRDVPRAARFFLRRLSMRLLSLLFMLCPVLAAAQDVSPADARAVRTVIEAQLDAFKHDDAKRAFSYAT